MSPAAKKIVRGKPAKKAAPKKAVRKTHTQAAITRVPRLAPKAKAAPAEERDYLVIYEEPDPYGLPSDDVLVLDIDARTPRRGEVDVQQKLDLELTNTTSRLGTAGFAATMVGCLLGLVLMVAFAVIYPQDWYSGSATTVRTMILLSVLTIALMIGGTVLTHYGRRIQARSKLSDVRIIEKASQNRASFE